MNPFKRIQYNAPVTITFALLALAVMSLAYLTGGRSTSLLFSVYSGPFNNPLFFVRLIGHVLGHANMEHFFGNFVIILLIGPMLEEKYSSRWMAVMMVITALATGLIYVLISGDAMMLGASGIVFMMILLSSFTNLRKGRIPLTLILALIIFLGREAVSGMTAADNISHLSHIIGGVCGALFGFFINKDKLQPEEAVISEESEVTEEK